MRQISTNLNLIDSTKTITVPAVIKLNEIDEDNVKIEISVQYNGKEYIGYGTEYLWEDAFVDLQHKLPKDIKVACCMTCRHGNMCPYGNAPRKMYCTKNRKVNSKEEVEYLFDTENLSGQVLCDSYCEDYDSQSEDYYTYNDYLYLLNK